MTFDQAKYDREQEDRRLHWARHCWRRRNQLSPNGLNFSQLFHKTEGITLEQFKEIQDEKKRKQKDS